MRAITSHLGPENGIWIVDRTGLNQIFQLAHGKFQIPRDAVWLMPQEFVSQGSIVPKSAFTSAVEPRPDGFANDPIIAEDGADVVELVRSGNEASVGAFLSQAADVFLLALAPRRLRVSIGVGAAVDHFRNASAEAAADFLQHGRSATIFDHIMQ